MELFALRTQVVDLSSNSKVSSDAASELLRQIDSALKTT
jgi:hypothetical protein